jgi:heavy metal sensor kinase
MPKSFSIRFRLAAWYFLSLAAVLGAVATGSYFAMRASMYRAIDEGLRYQILGVREFLRVHAGATLADLREELEGGASLTLAGGLLQFFDESGTLIYRSPGLARHDITTAAPLTAGETVAFRDAGRPGWPVRLAYQRLTIGGKPATIEVAEPLRSFQASLRTYGGWLLLFTPVLVLIASGVGFWISGRALAPVDCIIADAQAIGTNNLSERLSVPPARDELRHLSETLNDMLDRIEGSVTRITQFTADASHELRAPLALIQLAADHSLRRERSREELVEALRTVLRESKRTAQLVDNLLLLARADSGNDGFHAEPTDLTALLREVVEGARGLAAEKGVAFVPEIGESPVPVMGDAALLHRLVVILIDNAVKYTPENGEVRLTLRATPERACIDVVDTGVGIAAEDVPRIFDRFWRADKVRSRSTGGTGLGLSIAKWIVDRSGGTLTVESNLGRGSTFRVTLPVLPARGAEPGAAVLPGPEGDPSTGSRPLRKP